MIHAAVRGEAPQHALTILCYDLANAWVAADNGNGTHHVQRSPLLWRA